MTLHINKDIFAAKCRSFVEDDYNWIIVAVYSDPETTMRVALLHSETGHTKDVRWIDIQLQVLNV